VEHQCLPPPAPIAVDAVDAVDEEVRNRALSNLPLSDEAMAVPKSMTILTVDDAVSTQKIVGKSLRLRGHSVVRAENGAKALAIIGEQLDREAEEGEDVGEGVLGSPFDVVLMDLQMPVMDGIEAIKQLRHVESAALAMAQAHIQAQAEGDGVGAGTGVTATDGVGTGGAVRRAVVRQRQIVVAMSTNLGDETREEALAAGADYFITKPFTVETFEDILRVQGSD
jgi:CheY-like chemotaxis protein